MLPTNIQEILVQYLDDTYLPVLIKNHPVLDRITKKAMGGSAAKVPLQTGPGGGASGTFTNALANAQAGGAVNVAFQVTPAVVFGITTVTWDQVPYTDTEQSAMSIVTIATKNAMELATDNFASMIFSDGYGTLATIASNSNPSGNLYLLTLSVPTDVAKFNQNNVIVSKATPAAASLATGTATVLGLNQMGGTILVDGGGTWTPTNGYVIGLQGQMQASTSPVTFPGIFGFIPRASARTNGVPGDTFLSVVRTTSSTGVGVCGWAWSGVGQPLFPVINAAAGYMASYKNAKPDTLYCNPVVIAKLAQECDQKARYDMKSITMADVYFEGFEIMTAAGKVSVLAESACPADTLVLTKADQWIMGSPKNKPFYGSANGQIMVQDYDNNRARFSVTCSGFFYTVNPPATAVITITAPSGLSL